MNLKELNIIKTRTLDHLKKYKTIFMVCTGTGCVATGALNLVDKLKKEIKKRKLDNEYLVIPTGCIGLCSRGPIIVLQPAGIFYKQVQEKDIPQILDTLQEGNYIDNLLYRDPQSGKCIPEIAAIPFFNKQHPIVLRNRGIINPDNIEDAIARGAYQTLLRALQMKPDEIIDTIIKSGLRGRGGGGFPTGIKWQSAQEAAARKNEKPCLICNAYGSFKDSSIVETDPHAVIEGMTICALAVGASEGFIYINRESSLALARMTTAVTQAKEKGFLGREKTASGLSFDINIHRGADAFISGESSAMLAAISGKAGEPSAKYIHSAESGYHNRPTIVDNVETWANIPSIIEKGSSWFAGIGKGSTGTKIITLTGKIINYGLIEIEMGTSLREIIYDIGGGIGGNGNLKAVQVGGPSGGFLPASLLDIPVDFDSLTKAGSMMGTGSIVVMDDTTCMVNLVKNAISFLKGESCGKCTPCREGLIAINEMLDRITRGEGREGDVELMTEIAEVMKNASLCAFGKTAANPVLSTIKYFRDEYNTHIKDNKCNAGVCRELITYSVNDNCTGCTICAENCPVDAIRGIPKQKHSIDTKLCIKCGICSEVCKFAAITVQ